MVASQTPDGLEIVVTGQKPPPFQILDNPLYNYVPMGGVLFNPGRQINMPTFSLSRGTRSRLCDWGNKLETGAEFLGDGSVALTGAGALAAAGGVATANPLLAKGGVDLMAVGGVVGEFAGASQFAGGILQAASGNMGGLKNVLAAGVSFGTSALIARGLKVINPIAGRMVTAAPRIIRENRAVGNILGLLQNAADFLAPKKVKCP